MNRSATLECHLQNHTALGRVSMAAQMCKQTWYTIRIAKLDETCKLKDGDMYCTILLKRFVEVGQAMTQCLPLTDDARAS